MASNPKSSFPHTFVLPFPGARQSSSSPPDRAASSLPQPGAMPRPKVLVSADGRWSQEAGRVFTEWKFILHKALEACQYAKDGPNFRTRLLLLIQACEGRDIHYIVMHQVYCLWSQNKTTAYEILHPCHQITIGRAFSIFSLLISNELLLPHQLDWLSRFPAIPFATLIPPEHFNLMKNSICLFLSAVSSNWQQFQAQVILRDYPLLAHEAEQIFNCSSFVMHQLIFTFCRRNLGVHIEGPLTVQLNALFDSDKKVEFMLRSNPSMANEVRQTRMDLVLRYKTLIRQARLLTSQPQPPFMPNAASQNTSTASRITYPTKTTAPPSRPTPSADTQMAMQTLTPGPNQRMSCVPQQALQHYQQGRINTGYSISPAALPKHPVLPNATNQQISITEPAATSRALVNNCQAPAVSLGTPKTQMMDIALSREQFEGIAVSEYPDDPYGLSSLKVGLHLAQNRSPIRLPITPSSTKFFQYVDTLIVLPTKIDVSRHLLSIAFTLSEDEARYLPLQEGKLRGFTLPISRFRNHTCRFRLRVCRFEPQKTKFCLSEWANKATIWPEHMDVSVNSKPLTLRRKQHFHADLPLELTSFVQVGNNVIHISLPKMTEKESGSLYFAAIERITTQDYVGVKAMIEQNSHIPISTTLEEIKSRTGPSDIEEEVFLVGGTFNISVIDPLSAKLCDTPVRGASCKHMECFDLDNWLQSRRNKPGAAVGEPCLVDCWACPLCGGDARPGQLRVIDYFADICKQLAHSNLHDTRFVAIDTDGAWKVKSEALGRVLQTTQ